MVDRLGTAVTPAFVRRLQEQTEGNAFFIEETARALDDAGGVASHRRGRRRARGPRDPRGRRGGDPAARAPALAARLRAADGRVGGRALVRAGDRRAGRRRAARAGGRSDRGVPGGRPRARHPRRRRRLHVLARPRARRCSTATNGSATWAASCSTTAWPRRSSGCRSASRSIPPSWPTTSTRRAGWPARGRRARYSIDAGRRAAGVFAYEEATGHFRNALELFVNDDDERGRCEALLGLGRVQWHAGDDGARDTFQEAARSAELPRRRGPALAGRPRSRRAVLRGHLPRRALSRPAGEGDRRARLRGQPATRACCCRAWR